MSEEFGKKGERGFLTYGELTDSNGEGVSVVESSADPLVRCHLYCGEGSIVAVRGPEDRQFLQRAPHLNVRQALQLIAALTKFVEHKVATSHDEPLAKE